MSSLGTLLVQSMLLALAADGAAELPGKDEQRLKEEIDRYTAETLELAEKVVDSVRKHRSTTYQTVPVDQLMKSVKSLRDAGPLVRVTQLPNLEVGYITYLSRLWLAIESTSAGELQWRAASISRRQSDYLVQQVIDESNMLITKKNAPIVWVSGVSTTGLRDETSVTLNQLFEVVGTKQYETVLGGTKTVLLLEPFPIQDVEGMLQKWEAAEKASVAQADPAPEWKTEFRTWKDASGRFTVTAKYSGMIAGKVVLLKEDGEKIQVALEVLSQEDRALFDEN